MGRIRLLLPFSATPADYAPASPVEVEMAERMMREGEVAELLGVSKRTLQGWRWRGGGPPFVRIGGAVRYEPSDVRRWLEAQRRTSTSDTGEVSR